MKTNSENLGALASLPASCAARAAGRDAGAPRALRWLAGAAFCVVLLLFIQKAGAEWWPPPPPPNPDSDGDGLLDAWEIQYFGNLTQTPTGDYDSDGVNNLEEFQLGRNPTVGAVADTTWANGFLVFTPLK